MQGKTHLFTGVIAGAATGLAAFTIDSPNIAFATVVATVVGSIYPDIDNPKSMLGRKIKPISYVINKVFGHRNFVHSPFNLLLISLAATILCVLGGKQNFLLPLFGFIIGFILHLILDSITVGGIPFLYPFSKKRFHWTKMRTGGMGEKMFVGLMLIGIGALSAVMSMFLAK